MGDGGANLDLPNPAGSHPGMRFKDRTHPTMRELSDDELAQIERRYEQATGGPWRSFVEGREAMSGSDFIQTVGEDIYLSGATANDQDFIAAARQDVPILVAEVRRLRRLLAHP